MSNTRSIGREIGTAFAVLALYLLTVLAPLHHARASQIGFEALGYASLDASWVLCTPATPGDTDRDALIAKCPATGIGKTELALPTPVTLSAGLDRVALAAPLGTPSVIVAPRAIAPPGGSRAPPALA
jgi:hypothetical protein